MRFSRIALVVAALLGSPAAAQQDANPVSAHYRAYRAALERGDLAVADGEAAAALQASRSRDGNGGSTPALALNLALVRLGEGHRAEALDPAQLAVTLAAGQQAHIDPFVANIALKRAALTPSAQSGQDLLDALNAAQAHGGLDEHVYDGAADLGEWASQHDHLPVALSAWRLAVQASPGTTDTEILSHANALFSVGVLLLQMDIVAAPRPVASFSSATDSADPSYRPNPEVLVTLAEAARVARPLATLAAPDGSITEAQALLSRVTVLFLASESRADTYGVGQAELANTSFAHDFSILAHPGGVACGVQIVTEPRPHYPTGQMYEGNLGAVMVRFVIDGAGRVTDARVVAAVGGAAFSDAISRVVGRWTVRRLPNSVPNCDMAMTTFRSIQFRIAD